ncbi:Isochorismatase family protein [Perilla frutescens var. frutescens]|nr:Isochorismatase family protein [Perilla frutescens var. frutescens]
MGEAELKWKNTALLVIDMQKDLILPYSPASVKGGEAIVPNVIKAVEVARSRLLPIIWVVREHDPLGRDVELFRRHFYEEDKRKLVVKGSIGAELVDGLEIKSHDYKLVKTRFSAFLNTNLHLYLQGAGIKKLVVTVTVIVDATAAATPDIHNANVLDMKNIGVAAPTLEEWCKSDD